MEPNLTNYILTSDNLQVWQVNQQINEFGADVNSRGMMNQTPLHAAVVKNNVAIAKALIAKGADINAQNNKGQTPLHIAVSIYETGKTDTSAIINLLIENGADVFAKNFRDNTILAVAKTNTHPILSAAIQKRHTGGRRSRRLQNRRQRRRLSRRQRN